MSSPLPCASSEGHTMRGQMQQVGGQDALKLCQFEAAESSVIASGTPKNEGRGGGVTGARGSAMSSAWAGAWLYSKRRAFVDCSRRRAAKRRAFRPGCGEGGFGDAAGGRYRNASRFRSMVSSTSAHQ